MTSRLSALFRRDPPDRPLCEGMRDLWPTVQTAKVCREHRPGDERGNPTGAAWDKPDGREKMTLVFRVLKSIAKRKSA